jgi:hypothetical protein
LGGRLKRRLLNEALAYKSARRVNALCGVEQREKRTASLMVDSFDAVL